MANCDGSSIFDLTTRNPELIGNLNPNQTTITYHTSLSDASTGTNPIVTPNNYTLVSSPQVIYASINNLGTTTTNYFNLIQNSPLVISSVVTNPITCTNNATITTTASGGSGNYNYSLYWATNLIQVTPFQNSPVFSNLNAGSYIIRITDSLGCSAETSINITEPTSNLSCSATSNGNVITINTTGGNPPYQYGFSPNGPYATINTFIAINGTYTIYAVDMNGCICSSPVTVLPGLNVSIGATLDMPTSTLFADVFNGTQPYTYQWAHNNIPIAGAINSSLNVLGQYGLFSLIVTDSMGLTGGANYTVQGGTLQLNNDAFNVYPSSTGISVSNQSVLSNDFVGNFPASSTQGLSKIILTPISVPTGFLLNPNGTVSVLPGTASGQYTLTYQVCEIQFPNYCLSSFATITVVNNGILLKAFVDTNVNNIKDNGEINFNEGQFGYILNHNEIGRAHV